MLGIVIVNYKTNERLIKYINEELPKVSYPNKIVIVNNSATEESDQEIIAGCGAVLVDDRENIDKNAKIYLLSEQENHGYARGNNIGAKFLLQHFDVKYFCFSNCDLVFQDDDVVERLIDKIKHDPKIGLIGPNIVGLDGVPQSPRVMKNVWQIHIIPKLFYPVLPPRFRRKLSDITLHNASEGEQDYLNGSFFIVSGRAFIDVGMFDPATFIYAEEPILAIRMKAAGYIVYYAPVVSVLHEHSVTVKTVKNNDFVSRESYKANRYYQIYYKKINKIERLLFDLSYWVYLTIWYPLCLCVRTILSRRAS
jgi:GT2 family glycosyltransferase